MLMRLSNTWRVTRHAYSSNKKRAVVFTLSNRVAVITNKSKNTNYNEKVKLSLWAYTTAKVQNLLLHHPAKFLGLIVNVQLMRRVRIFTSNLENLLPCASRRYSVKQLIASLVSISVLPNITVPHLNQDTLSTTVSFCHWRFLRW